MDYCWCPKYYQLKNANKHTYNLKTAYDNAMHRCFYSYLNMKQSGGDRNGIDYLKQAWGKEWIKQKTNSDIIITPSSQKRDTYDQKRRNGIDGILAFYNLIDADQYPLIINKEYRIQIQKNVFLTGKWEYIREVRNKDGLPSIEIIKIRTEANRFLVGNQIHYDIELTAMAYAFLTTFNLKNEPLELTFMDLYHKKMIPTIRTENDFDILKKTVVNVVKCIYNNIEYFSPDKRCYHCDYRDECIRILKR